MQWGGLVAVGLVSERTRLLAKLRGAQISKFYLDRRQQTLLIAVLSSGRLGISAEMLLSVLKDFLNCLRWKRSFESFDCVGASAAYQGDGLMTHNNFDPSVDYWTTRGLFS